MIFWGLWGRTPEVVQILGKEKERCLGFSLEAILGPILSFLRVELGARPLETLLASVVRARFWARWAASNWAMKVFVGFYLCNLLSIWKSFSSLSISDHLSLSSLEEIWIIVPLITTLWADHRVSGEIFPESYVQKYSFTYSLSSPSLMVHWTGSLSMESPLEGAFDTWWLCELKEDYSVVPKGCVSEGFSGEWDDINVIYTGVRLMGRWMSIVFGFRVEFSPNTY